MPHVIHHPHPAPVHHHTTLYVGIGLLVMVAVILALSLVPTITVQESVALPITANQSFPDYAQRHPELTLPMPAALIDTSDYYFRHINLNTRLDTDDQTDYIFRHSELVNP